MKKAMVEKTPHVWKAWFICSWDGYVTAASIIIHQPVKNWKRRIQNQYLTYLNKL